MGRMDFSQLLLLDNALVPWFILVPETDETEFYELDERQQLRLLAELNQLSTWVDQHFSVDKLNVAMIGNKVPQMHIHVVGRFQGDYCWPGVVWAAPEREAYSSQAVREIREALIEALPVNL